MGYSLIDTDTTWNNKTDIYTVYAANNDYTVKKTTIGAYDEDGNESIGIAGEIEVIKENPATDSAIMTVLSNKGYDPEEDNYSISLMIESDPDDLEQTFEEVIKIIEFVA